MLFCLFGGDPLYYFHSFLFHWLREVLYFVAWGNPSYSFHSFRLLRDVVVVVFVRGVHFPFSEGCFSPNRLCLKAGLNIRWSWWS